MNAFDAPRIDALARALELSPRQLLVAAMRLARADAADSANEAERRRRALAQVCVAPPATEAVAALLLTPIASYAQDDIDRALANLWPVLPSADV
jgi:hypothetical protein